MAIKIVGNTVITDTRSIVNVVTANITSTTYLASITGNVLIGRTTDSTVGRNVELDVAGSVNSTGYLINGYPIGVNVGATTPPTVAIPEGTLWWNSNIGRLLIYYSDGDSSQWVDATPTSQGPIGPKSITISTPQTGDDFTIFFTNQQLTLNRIQAVTTSQTPSWANSTCNVIFYSSTTRGLTGTIITQAQGNIVANTTSGNSITTFANAVVPANSYIWVVVNSTVNTPAEFHASMFFT